jgi:hypothetical protein
VALVVAFAAPAAAAETASAPVLEVPVDCAIGAPCVVQNYVDQDPGPGAQDHACGPLSYDGHRGLDIRVPGAPEMRAGVPVLAAAPGVVTVARDGLADAPAPEPAPTGRPATPEAGNVVVIDHGRGWESQYSHLRRGSLVVRRGQRVEAGARLGLIGRSGTAAFPHVHFEIRHRGRAMDPFTGLPAGSGCGRHGMALWSPTARAALGYRAGGLLRAGFATQAPSLERALAHGNREGGLGAEAPALVFWVAAWGVREGDLESISILAPDGRVLARERGRLPKDQAQRLRYAGAERRGAAFAPGRYRGEYRLLRDTGGRRVVVIELSRTAVLR